MKYIIFLIVVCCFLPAKGQETYGRTIAGQPKVEYAPDKKGEWARKQVWKNFEVIPDYHDEYANCFCTGERLLVITDRTGKIKEYYVGPTFKRLERINKFIKRYIEKY